MIKSKATTDSGFLRHPFTLLVCGWLLTGVLGTWLTTCWESREKDRERHRLARELEIKQRVALFEETTTAVAETFTAAEDIVSIFEYGPGPGNQQDIAERVAHWKSASREWRTRSKVLSAKLAATYTDPRIPSQFQGIVNSRRQLGNDIVNHLGDLAHSLPEKLPQWAADSKEIIQKTTGSDGTLPRLVGLFHAEIKATAEQPD